MSFVTAVTAVALLLGAIAPAHAYIDPGSGSYMLQLAMAGLMAIVFSVKMSWQRLRANVSGLRQHRLTTRRGQ